MCFARLIVAAIVLGGCTGEAPVRAEDAATLLDSDATDQWTYAIGEYPEKIVPSLLKEAKKSDVELQAIVRTQHGFHSMTYSLFLDTGVVFNSFFGGTMPQKGTLPLADSKLASLVTSMEAADSCDRWPGNDLQGDFLIYKTDEGYRACVEPLAWPEGGTLREQLWSLYDPARIDWSHNDLKKITGTGTDDSIP